MYQSHAWARSPRDLQVPLWRYFRLNRFVDLLEAGQLYFSRLDQFADQFEGVLPSGTVSLPKDGFTNQPRQPGDELTDFQMLIRDLNRIGKLCTYANCWYMNTHESEGMWRLYGSDGVAIRSSYARLCDSFANEPRSVYVGVARYLDYNSEQPETYGNSLAIAFNKRIEFEHERELRAIIVHEPDDWTSGSPPYEEYRDKHPRGVRALTDLNVLIDQIVLAPGTTVRTRATIIEAMERCGLAKTVVSSTLDQRPTLL